MCWIAHLSQLVVCGVLLLLLGAAGAAQREVCSSSVGNEWGEKADVLQNLAVIRALHGADVAELQ